MVKFLVQNSLGATWMGMNPDSKLADGWEYYVRDADRAPVARKPVAEITLLDPAVGRATFCSKHSTCSGECTRRRARARAPR